MGRHHCGIRGIEYRGAEAVVIEWDFFAGHNDEPHRDAASVDIQYWTVSEDDFLEIDEQLMAQFLGVA